MRVILGLMSGAGEDDWKHQQLGEGGVGLPDGELEEEQAALGLHRLVDPVLLRQGEPTLLVIAEAAPGVLERRHVRQHRGEGGEAARAEAGGEGRLGRPGRVRVWQVD